MPEGISQQITQQPKMSQRNHDRRATSDRRSRSPGRRWSDAWQDSETGELTGAALEAGPFRVDDRNKVVFVEDQPQRLSPKEYALLKLLVLNQDRVVSNQEIIEHLWPRSDRATTSDVKQYVHLLRKKVENNPRKPRWIQNIKGFGYQLTVNNALINRA